MKQLDKDTYQVGTWKIEFGVRFGFTVTSKNSREARNGVYYYTGEVDLFGGKRLPRPILNALITICRQRHRAGLMPNRR